MITRRNLIFGTAGAVLLGGCKWWPDGGIRNPCRAIDNSQPAPRDAWLAALWDDLEPADVWDCHVHLAGTGDSDSGIWINPAMDSVLHPVQFLQKKFYLNAACAEDGDNIDNAYLARLHGLLDAFPDGVRLMLLALDYYHDDRGRRSLRRTAFHTPNEYAARVAAGGPGRLEWIASIHPYRSDAVSGVRAAHARGARAIKWLPPAMGIDPASPRCDPFYEALAGLGLPLLTHAGSEAAVHGGGDDELGNPLKLRRPLEHGVTVIVAHCASLGAGADLDSGRGAKTMSYFELFARLMDEPRFATRLYGDISGVTQLNRIDVALETLVTRRDWHSRLLNGSDYPLPGVLPLYSLRYMRDRGYLTAAAADGLGHLRRSNPLLFDFALKRLLRVNGAGFPAQVFATRRVFDRARPAAV